MYRLIHYSTSFHCWDMAFMESALYSLLPVRVKDCYTENKYGVMDEMVTFTKAEQAYYEICTKRCPLQFYS